MFRSFFLALSSIALVCAYSPFAPAQSRKATIPSVESSETISRRNLLASAAAVGASSLFIDPLGAQRDQARKGARHAKGPGTQRDRARKGILKLGRGYRSEGLQVEVPKTRKVVSKR